MAKTRKTTTKKCKTKKCHFISLCKKYIMINKLDRVIKTTWLQKNNCNVFLIGEVHKPHQKCIPLIDMFKNLVQHTSKLSLDIDLFVEIFQHDTVRILDNYKVPNKDVQINHVRKYFNKCFTEHNCPVRIHWADPTQTNLEKNIQPWLIELSKYSFVFFTNDWFKNKKITSFFNKEQDIPRLLTDNRIVVKEIGKASIINKHFTLDFATKLFMEFYLKSKEKYIKEYNRFNWTHLVTLQLRFVIDFYVAARIIKSDMKNVIYYAGYAHTNNITTILNALEFKTMEIVNGNCYDPVEVSFF